MTAGTELRRFASPAELVEAAATEWIESLLERGPAAKTSAALPGGRLALSFLEACTRRARPQRNRLPQIDLFWADERCVPPDHPDSNSHIAQEALIRPLEIPPTYVHRTIGEIEPARAAEQLERELRATLPLDPAGIPRIDWVFLGMGEDGHIASLFPGNSADLVEPAPLVLPVTAPKPPPQRVTMGYRLLTAATHVRVLISGAGKTVPLQRALVSTESPLGKLLARRPHTKIFVDFPPAATATSNATA